MVPLIAAADLILKLINIADLALKGAPKAIETWNGFKALVLERQGAGGTLTADDIADLNAKADVALAEAKASIDALPE